PADAAPADAALADAAPADAASADAAPADEAPATGDSDEPGATEGVAGASSASEQPEGGKGERKKRRRRRRRGQKSAEGDPAGGEGAPSSGARRGKKHTKPERPAFNVGDDVFGRVSKLGSDAIWIDVAGGKAEGLFDRSQLIQIPPKEGEQMIATVKSVSTRGGMLLLGPDPWDTTQSRAELRAALQMETQLDFWVTGVIKGGLEVDYKGVRAFAPASHVELRPSADLTHLLGQKMQFVVTTYGKKGRDVVVSRKGALRAEHKEKRNEELGKLEPGMKCKAIVRTVLQWGAFVALPEHSDVEGVIHMSEASHNRSARLDQLFRPGAKIEVEVLRIDDKGKLWLSHKATIADPWDEAPKKYAAGTLLTGKVVRLTDFGAFIQLEPGIDGLCHVADLSFNPVAHPKEVVTEGTDMEVVVAHLDAKARKVTLHPAPPEDERDAPPIRRVQAYKLVDVVVMQIRDAGLGVRIVGATGRNARGFIPAGQTGTPRGTDLRKGFPLGKRMQVKVIDADTRRGEPRLSIRAVKQDAEKQAYRDYRKKVQREATFGTFADLLKDKI
ncbi:MAG: S1 RNA-binding domain-containing protein, partial [Deltaproteobacteria bacterium]|nr:S1 RNA-binding domain-containing protein [Deltaproteobacteria bacterium]